MSSPEDGTIDAYYPFHTPMDDVDREKAEDFRIYILDETLDNSTLTQLNNWRDQHDLTEDTRSEE